MRLPLLRCSCMKNAVVVEALCNDNPPLFDRYSAFRESMASRHCQNSGWPPLQSATSLAPHPRLTIGDELLSFKAEFCGEACDQANEYMLFHGTSLEIAKK